MNLDSGCAAVWLLASGKHGDVQALVERQIDDTVRDGSDDVELVVVRRVDVEEEAALGHSSVPTSSM